MNLFRTWKWVALSTVCFSSLYAQPTPPQLVPFETLPPYGTFWSLQRSNCPPLPQFAPYLREAESPVYLLDAQRNVFLVDDSGFDYAALFQEREQQRQQRYAAWKLGLISDAEYWAEESGYQGPMDSASYGPEDFWIELVGITDQLAYLTLHGTIGDGFHYYQLLSKTNLAQKGEWKLGEVKRGDLGTNQTDLSPLYVGNDTNMFFRGQYSRGVVSITRDSDDAIEANPIFPSGRTAWMRVNAAGFDEDLTVYYRVSGTASNGVDYTNLSGVVTVPVGSIFTNLYIQPIVDNLPEGIETVVVTLAQTNTYLIDPYYQATTNGIKDSNTEVRIRTDFPAIAYEQDGPPGVPAQNGIFYVERLDWGPDYPPLTVLYSLSGRAVNGVDYATVSSSLTLTQGQESATITIQPLSDTLVEGTEEVILSLVPTNTYMIKPGSESDTNTIADSSTTVGIQFAANALEPNPASRLPSQTGQFTLTRSDTRFESPALTVSYQLSGTASNGVDYTNLTGTVTIPAGLPSVSIFIEPNSDNQIEGNETVILTLTSIGDGYLIHPESASATNVVMDNFATNTFQRIAVLANPAGIDYHALSNQIIVSFNYDFSGQPSNFLCLSTNLTLSNNGVVTNVVITNWSRVHGISDEVKLVTSKTTANGFTNGDLYFGNGNNLGWVSANGTASNLTWCVLTNTAGQTNNLDIRGSLCFDETGVFSNGLVVVASFGNADFVRPNKGVWRVSAQGVPTLITNINTPHLEGAIVLPNNPTKWGPWAGKIVTGDESQNRIFTVDGNGVVTPYDPATIIPLGICVEDFEIIPPNQDLYGCDLFGNAVVKLSRNYLTNYVGDLLITDAGEYDPPGKLFILRWNAAITNFTAIPIPYQRVDNSDGLFEHVTFAPIDFPALAP